MTVSKLLRPKTLAIVGASPKPESFGASLLQSIRYLGFPGEVHLVNPRYERIDGQPCYPDVASIPGGVDCAALAVDALGHRHLTGHIEGFSPAAGSEFAVIKPDNATGNFTKIAQRIGTRIRLDEGQDAAALLAPGLSVVVTVDKASSPDPKFTAH